MFTKAVASGTMLFSLLLSPFAVAPAQAVAPTSEPQPCVFETYTPQAIAAYYVDDPAWYSTDKTLRGVQLYIPAREGLTKEWLELSVLRTFASPANVAGQSCRPDVSKVEVSVSSAGPGFWVSLSALRPRSAEALLKWAKANIVTCEVTAEKTSCASNAYGR
jgi:hypothetical protein